MGRQYYCKNEQRRRAVRDHSRLNGIDFLEVLDQEAPKGSPRQRTLLVHCFKPLLGFSGGMHIEGGIRIRSVEVLWAFPAPDIPDSLLTSEEKGRFSLLPNHVLVIRTDSSGDSSPYRLRLVKSQTDPSPPESFDLQLSEIEFSFKVDCPSELDCKSVRACPPEKLPEPEINYLAKDYAGFRRLMLDRLAVIMPDWKERNPADLGVALVEVLAYAADSLSYFQDAVATEAYLGTARKRTSVRRHARLLDYLMHDGCNARAWVQVQVNAGHIVLAKGTPLLTSVVGLPPRIEPDSPALAQALSQQPQVFETLHEVTLFDSHNVVDFYTWGDEQCCLPKGATRATLRDNPENRLRLCSGDVLILEERLGPVTGLEADADPTRRHAVRLTRVDPQAQRAVVNGKEQRTAEGLITDPLTGEAIVEIEWDAQDALPFPLCVSTMIDGRLEDELGLARGNIVLIDHGRTIVEDLDEVPETHRYRPRLKFGPPTQQGHVRNRENGLVLVDPVAPASAAMRWEVRHARPAIVLVENGDKDQSWLPQHDLLSSDRFAREFVVEVEADGRALLRFGDDVLGRRPTGGRRFQATYRVGNGRAGNVGAGAIAHVVTSESSITKVHNPLAAQGGADPEPIEQVRLYAPQAFRTQERAVTEADYAEVAERHPDIQRAAATLRWTGSWHTMFVTVDRKGGREVDDGFKAELRAFLERFRLAGHDLEIDAPRFVPLDIAFTVCVARGYFRSDVKAALLETFSNVDLLDGRRGFFHPDNFTFGQPVYLSRLVATAMQVPGVLWVDTDDRLPKRNRFGRQAQPSQMDEGRLVMGRLEIVRLDNDPSAPENGKIELFMEGGL